MNGQGGPPRQGGAGGMGTMVVADDVNIYPGSATQSRQGDGYSGEG